jgi:hypothetical protein
LHACRSPPLCALRAQRRCNVFSRRGLVFFCHTLSLPPPLALSSVSRAQSGIDISEELLALFEDVKLRHKHKYFVFSLKPTGKVRRAAAAAQRARRRFAQAVSAAAR